MKADLVINTVKQEGADGGIPSLHEPEHPAFFSLRLPFASRPCLLTGRVSSPAFDILL
jgi:hypothetical protein